MCVRVCAFGVFLVCGVVCFWCVFGMWCGVFGVLVCLLYMWCDVCLVYVVHAVCGVYFVCVCVCVCVE